jgi:hypothetical protein
MIVPSDRFEERAFIEMNAESVGQPLDARLRGDVSHNPTQCAGLFVLPEAACRTAYLSTVFPVAFLAGGRK